MRITHKLSWSTLFTVLVLIAATIAIAAGQPQPDDLWNQSMRLFQNPQQLKFAAAASQHLSMSEKGSISGHVRGLDSSAISMAYVRAVPLDPDQPKGDYTEGFAVVDSQFTYRIDSLAVGKYIVMAFADGYELQYYQLTNSQDAATTVGVLANAVTPDIDFVLTPVVVGTGKISGYVRADKDNAPIAGAVVYVRTLSEPFQYGKNMTDENGYYEIGELKSGDYVAEVLADGYVSEIYDHVFDYAQATLIPVVEPDHVTGIDFSLSTGSKISGHVYDQNGHPMGRVYVQAEPLAFDAGQWQDPYNPGYGTDLDGYYELSGLRPGAYLLKADYWTEWGGITVWFPGVEDPAAADTVYVTENEEISGMDFHMSLPSSIGVIHGKVTDAAGNPIAHAYFYLQPAPQANADGKWMWFSTVTGLDGEFRIEKIPEGDYVAYCYAQNGWQFVHRYWPDARIPEEAKVISIHETSPDWRIDFNLPIKQGSASVSGFVRNQVGAPLANAYVQITSSAPPDAAGYTERIYAYTSTDSSGFYLVEALPAGDYLAYVSYWENQSFGQQWHDHADNETSAAIIALQDNESRREINFDLNVKPIYGAITGMVTDAATGAPIERAYVEIRYQHNNSEIAFRPYAYWPYHAITDMNGQYAVDWLPEGEYQVSVYANGGFAIYPDAVVPEMGKLVQVVGGEKSETNFSLALRQEGTAAITGRVSGDYGIRQLEPGDDRPEAGRFMLQQEYIPEIAVVMAKPAVTIMMYPQSEMFYTAVTDPDGHYSLKGLPAGEYYVMSFAPGHMLQYYKEQFDPAQAELVHLEQDEVKADIDFILNQMWYRLKEGDNRGASTLTANVAGSVVDENGNALSGAGIYLINSDGQAVSFTVSDQNGNYEIIGVPPGQYYVQAGKIGYDTNFNGIAPSMEQTTPFSLGNGTTTIEIILNVSGSTGVDDKPAVPETLVLYGNYPNPFNPETHIRFALPGTMEIRLVIYDRLGREIKRVHEGVLGAGEHSLLWDGRDASGNTMSSGIYIYRLAAPGWTRSGKMALLR